MARQPVFPTGSGLLDPSRRRGLLDALGGLGAVTLIGCGGGTPPPAPGPNPIG